MRFDRAADACAALAALPWPATGRLRRRPATPLVAACADADSRFTARKLAVCVAAAASVSRGRAPLRVAATVPLAVAAEDRSAAW